MNDTDQTQNIDSKMNRNNLYSWLILFVLGWVFIGSIISPYWWYDFFFNGKILNFNHWAFGLNEVFIYLIYNPIILIFIACLFLVVKSKKIKLNLPTINIFKKNNLLIPIILPVLIVIFIWNSNSRYQIPTMIEYAPDEGKPEQQTYLQLPVDFLYLNTDRINNLYSQIKPQLVLKEKTFETESQAEKRIKGGSEQISAERKKASSKKEINSYTNEETPLPKRATQLLNHFSDLGQIQEYQTLEISSEDLKKLEEFRNVSEQFIIEYNQQQYNSIYSRILNEKLVAEREQLRQVDGQVVIKGEYVIGFNGSQIILKHNYVKINNNNGIQFVISSLSEIDDDIMSLTLKDKTLNEEKINLNVFGKIIRQGNNGKMLNIYIEPYAIW